jgi:hypothetical protein
LLRLPSLGWSDGWVQSRGVLYLVAKHLIVAPLPSSVEESATPLYWRARHILFAGLLGPGLCSVSEKTTSRRFGEWRLPALARGCRLPLGALLEVGAPIRSPDPALSLLS